MSQVGQEGQTWPGGLTYVFQGTVAEDATAGTHVCTLTVTPGQGNEMYIIGGEILEGNTATTQQASVVVDDGVNELYRPGTYTADVSANVRHVFPGGPVAFAAGTSNAAQYFPAIISGSMRLVLTVSTAAVSVTQTFSVVCRIHGAKPTAVLNDTIGTSTNTINTDAVF